MEEELRRGVALAAALGGANRAHLLAIDQTGGEDHELFEWKQEGAPGLEDSDWRSYFRHFHYFTERFLAGDTIHVPSVANLPEEAAEERDALLASGVRSLLSIPIHRGKAPLASLALAATDREHEWSESQITQLRLLGQTFAGALWQRHTARSLRRNEERFRALTEYAKDAICELDAMGRLLYSSPSFLETFGIAADDLRELDFLSLVHPDERTGVATALGLDDTDPRLVPVTYRARDRGGEWRWFEATGQRFESADGEAHTAVAIRDVTDRVQMQRALERRLELETRLAELSRHFLGLGAEDVEEGIFDGLSAIGGLIGVDRAWLVSVAADGASELARYEWAAEGVPKRVDAVTAEKRWQFPWASARLMAGRVLRIRSLRELPPEADAEKEDMQERGVTSMLGVPLLSGDRFAGYVGFECLGREQDWGEETVTLLRLVGDLFVSALRRKRAEENLRESQEQLVQSQKMEAIGRLAGGIAHDFNNLLMVISGCSDALRERVDASDALREDVDEIHGAAQRAASLTRQLLAFSRRQIIEPRTLDLGHVVAGLEPMLRRVIGEDVELVTQRVAPLGAVKADPGQIEQVLLNLAVNARDAMPDGGRLEVQAANRRLSGKEARALGLPSGLYVELLVRDTGAGMDDDTRARVFEPFFTTKERGRGTGLGLSIVYGIVRQSGGGIQVESERRRGTAFHVLLPQTEDAAHSTPEREWERGEPGHETVLLVEDEASVRRLVRRVLEENGYRVIEASDGREGLELGRAHSGDIDLLVSDLVMPHMGGLELARRLRDVRSSLRFLFLTGYADDRTIAEERDWPSAHFLQKPIAWDRLLSEVRRALDGPDPSLQAESA
ncbi:MAG: response regulator [Proteobacteria bacterium]|nr:response regulator [Pseudomonadota bacterium]